MHPLDQTLLQAIGCIENGHYELALRKLASGTADAGTRPTDHYFRAVAHRALGDVKAAVTDHWQAVALCGLTQISALKDMMRWGVRDATGYFNRGCAYHNEGDLDRAINNYSEAAKLEPDRAMALLCRAMALKARDRNNPESPVYDERHGGTPDRDRAEDDLIAVLKLTAPARLHAVARDELASMRRHATTNRPRA